MLGMRSPRKIFVRTERALHREMWDWLSKNPEKEKDDWLTLVGDLSGVNEGYPANYARRIFNEVQCFACAKAAAKTSGIDQYLCTACPIPAWRKDSGKTLYTPPCTRYGSPYDRWRRLTKVSLTGRDRDLRASLAEYIRDMWPDFPGREKRQETRNDPHE